MSERIRLAVPSIDDADCEAVVRVLRSGMLVQGAEVAAFEARLAERVGVAHAVAVVNCTAALHLSLVALGVGPGRRVAVATYSWPSTVNAVYLAGAEPVFVDVDPATGNMDPARLAEVLDRTEVTAVLPVHTFGRMADVAALVALADGAGVPLLEDAACALGASLAGRAAGAWGRAGCFSFHPRKAITTGEGGAVTTDDAALADRLRRLRNHGLDPHAAAPDFVEAGYNLRLTEFQAALGCTQLDKLDRLVSARRAAAAHYDVLLSGTAVAPPPVAPEPSAHVYQSYVASLPAAAAPRRAEVLARLREQGIEATIGTYHQPLITHVAARTGHRAGDFPATDAAAGRAISLPLFEGITVGQQERVVETLLGAL
jgi:perosamine synthetase